jgi:hypothetical protein
MTNEGKIHPLRAIRETLVLIPSFALTKFILFFFASLWSFVPFIGWYKDLRYRLRWAMVSNVHVFEGSSTDLSLQRSDDLVDLMIEKKKADALLTIPILLYVVLLSVLMIISSMIQLSILFWISGIVVAWIIFPGSAMVNTLVYLSITKDAIPEEVIG